MGENSSLACGERVKYLLMSGGGLGLYYFRCGQVLPSGPSAVYAMSWVIRRSPSPVYGIRAS